MEIFEGKKMADETLSGVRSVSQPEDDGQKFLKPSLEETVGDDLGTVVVTTKVVESTEVSVVEMIQEDDGDKEDEFMKNQEVEGNEGMENVTEGLFGDLDDDDDDDDDDDGGGGGGGGGGMNVNCSENGTSQAMDVEDSKAGEDASGINLVSEGNAGFLAVESGDNAGGDPMDISLPPEKEQNKENGTEVFETNDETNKNDEENVEIGEDNRSKLAENKELNGEQGGEEEDHNFLVGDFVWGKIKSHLWWPGQIYNPSDASENAARLKGEGQLLVAYFGDGSFSWCSPSQLKPFIDHFPEMSNQSDSKKFVNAVKMALGEVSRLVEAEWMCKCQTVKRVGNTGVVNKGIKKGVLVPKGNTIKVLVDRMEPLELLLTLKGCAAMDPGTGLGALELTLLKSCLNVFYRTRGSYLLVEYHDPKRIKGLDINGPLDSLDNGDDKSYQRKQKSVAELLREDEPKSKRTKISKDGGSGKRKRKALVVSVTPESDNESGGGGVENVEEETMSPRQRKKSKYLSPPYLSPVGGGKLSIFGSGPGSGSFKEPKPEPEKVPEMAAVEDSSKKSSGKRSRPKQSVREGSDPQEEQKTTIDADANVNNVLHGLLRVALDPTSFEEDLPVVTDFISSYRRSIFKEGSSSQTDQKINSGDTMDVAIIKQKSETDRKKRAGDTSDVLSIKRKVESDRKKKTGDTSDLAFIKQKLESMMGIVQRCEETQMSADVKASLEGGIQEVLERVGKMKGK